MKEKTGFEIQCLLAEKTVVQMTQSVYKRFIQFVKHQWMGVQSTGAEQLAWIRFVQQHQSFTRRDLALWIGQLEAQTVTWELKSRDVFVPLEVLQNTVIDGLALLTHLAFVFELRPPAASLRPTQSQVDFVAYMRQMSHI